MFKVIYSLNIFTTEYFSSWTYHNDYEIQNAPPIREIFGETISNPFQDHFEREQACKHIFQYV